MRTSALFAAAVLAILCVAQAVPDAVIDRRLRGSHPHRHRRALHQMIEGSDEPYTPGMMYWNSGGGVIMPNPIPGEYGGYSPSPYGYGYTAPPPPSYGTYDYDYETDCGVGYGYYHAGGKEHWGYGYGCWQYPVSVKH